MMSTLATCPICQRLMDGASCTERRASAWGDEPGWDEPCAWACHDCGTPPGGRHHHGCCVALCALGCRNPDAPTHPAQALFCDHHTDCEPPDDDGDELEVAPHLHHVRSP